MSQVPQAKKLVLVLATSLSVTGTSKEAPKVKVLNKISCICYPVQFRKNKDKDVLALLNSGSKINAMTSAYTAHLDLKVRVTNVDAQKIDGFLLVTYGMVITAFQVVNKLGCFWFFQKTFLLAEISMEVILGMPFLIFGNVNVQFAKKELI